MKVIFLQNIEEQKVGDVKNVADGYARNYLLPRGIAEIATEGKLKEIEAKLSKIKKEEAENVAKAKKTAEELKKAKIILTKEVNEDGLLYGAITNKEIAEALEEKKFEIDPSGIEIENPIKEIGKHEILVKVGHGVEATLTIAIKREK